MSESGLPRPRMLVIDDDPHVAEFVTLVGEMAGFESCLVQTSSQLDSQLRPPPDVIVLDLMMPGLDGIQVLRELAARKTPARLILMSGLDRRVLESASRLAQAQGLTVVGALQKPVALDRLKQLLLEQRPIPLAGRPAPSVTWEELARAISKDQLEVHYQPQVSLEDGRWCGLEALVRWNHPDYGLLPPSLFVPLAEKHGLALDLTYWVLDAALRDHVTVLGRNQQRALSINLPASALHDLSFPERVQACVDVHGASQARLVFEITETSIPAEQATTLDILTRLRMRNYGISIDDFGTGHSSLERLHQLPVTELKIDRHFVAVWETDSGARAIAENAISLGRQLGVGVVAEGVEDSATLEWLRQCECHLAQGYFVGRPMRATELQAWAHRWNAYEPAVPWPRCRTVAC